MKHVITVNALLLARNIEQGYRIVSTSPIYGIPAAANAEFGGSCRRPVLFPIRPLKLLAYWLGYMSSDLPGIQDPQRCLDDRMNRRRYFSVFFNLKTPEKGTRSICYTSRWPLKSRLLWLIQVVVHAVQTFSHLTDHIFNHRSSSQFQGYTDGCK